MHFLIIIVYRLGSGLFVAAFQSDVFVMYDCSLSLGKVRSALCLLRHFGSISDDFATFATSLSWH